MDHDPRHEECWAKTTADGQPGINVLDHCLNVGCVAEALLKQATYRAPAGAATLAALHDVGKVSPGFQRKCEPWLVLHGLAERARKGWLNAESDHAQVSQDTVAEMLRAASPWAAAVGAHHGKIKQGRKKRHDWLPERIRLAEELVARFGPLPNEKIDVDDDSAVWYVAGLITVADWIGSDEINFPQDAKWGFAERQARARAVLKAIHWELPAVRRSAGFADLFPQTPCPNGLQTAATKAMTGPGVYVIEGPMGCGKTEAALAAAHGLISSGAANGLYFALPTQTTSNRIHRRVEDFVERISDGRSAVRLAHSNSWLTGNEMPPRLYPAARDDESRKHVSAGRSWFASAKRALLATYGVGTVDQALLGIVAAKHFFVRQFALAGKVVVLDEVHSYDLYTGTLIDVLVRRLRELGCTVIVLSATLTAERRRQLLGVEDGVATSDAYPLLSASRPGKPLLEIPTEPPRPKSVTVRFADPDELVEEALERAQAGQCVLWIRNTVDEAQQTYRDLKEANREGGPEIGLLHSRFPFFRREELESRWMEQLGKETLSRPRGCVLISTQVAEQSVDIDADLLITDLAPTDMLLQRIGRLWRHDRERPSGWKPEVWIREVPLADDQFNSATAEEWIAALGKSAKVYSTYVLVRTLLVWRSRSSVTLPADIRKLLAETYAEASETEPAALRSLRQGMEERKKRLAEIADAASRVWYQPALPDDEGVQTRFSDYPSAGLLLARSIEERTSHSARLVLQDGSDIVADAREWSFQAARAFHRNLIRMPRWAVSDALHATPAWLSFHLPQPTALGLLRDDGSVAWRGSEDRTGLSYGSEEGLVIKREPRLQNRWEEFDESYD